MAPKLMKESEGAARVRDDINPEIQAVLRSHVTPLKSDDFDLRARQCLHAIYGKGGKESVKEALGMVATYAAGKPDRQSVQCWPAYVGAILRRHLDQFEAQISSDASGASGRMYTLEWKKPASVNQEAQPHTSVTPAATPAKKWWHNMNDLGGWGAVAAPMVARAAGGGRQRRLGGEHKVDASAAEEFEAEAGDCSECDDLGNEEAMKLAWQRREAARNRQIMIGKARPEYRRYINEVSKPNRSSSQPLTPDPRARVSKRQFDRALGEWRRRLHDYDASPWHQKENASPGVNSGAAQSPSKITRANAALVRDSKPSPPLCSATEVGTAPRKGGRGKMGQRHKASPAPTTDTAPAAVVRLRLEDHLSEAEHATPQPSSLHMQAPPGGIEGASTLMQLSDWEANYFPGFNYEPWPFSPTAASALSPTTEASRAADAARADELELKELELLDLADAELLQLGSTKMEVATPLAANRRPGATRATSSPLIREDDDMTPAKLDAPASSNHSAVSAQAKKTVSSPASNDVQVKVAAAHGAAGRLPTPPPLPRRSFEQTDGPPPATPEQRFGEVTRNPPTSIGSYSSLGIHGTPQMSRFLQVPRTPSPDRVYWGEVRGAPQQQVWAPDPLFWSYPGDGIWTST